MPQPINIPIPKVDAYQPTQSTGLNFAQGQQAGLQAAAPLAASAAQDVAKNDQATQAAKFNQLLRSGADGMQAYIADAAKVNPDLAQEFAMKFQTIQPYLKTLKGKDLVETTLNIYDGWNNQMNGLKVGKALQDNPDDINPALAVSGLGAKEMINAKSQSIRTDAAAKASDAMVTERTARAAYYTQLPKMKQDLVKMQTEAKARLQHLKLDGNGGAQIKYGVAKQNFDAVTKQIADLSDKIPKAEKILAEADPYDPRYEVMAKHVNDMAHQLRFFNNEKDKYQGWMNAATDKGARPGDTIGTETGSRSNSLTAESSDEEISQALKAKGRPSTQANIDFVRKNLGGDSSQVAP